LIRRCVDNDHERQVEAFRRILAALRAEPGLAQQVAESAVGSAGLLKQWTEASLDRLRSLDDGSADRYEAGWWSCSYLVAPVAEPPSLPALRTILFEIKGTETGWPVWLSLEGRPGMGAYVAGNAIECWLRETDSADFWRADPRGRMFLLRRLQEDTEFRDVPPGTFLDLILPIWRTGECLLHAGRLAARLGADSVDMTMSWHGLAGRELRALAGPNRMLMPGRLCNDSEISTIVAVSAAEIQDTLPELVKALVAPLSAEFGFFQPPDELYTSELQRMRTGIR
jgi:hypothetical protein